jgi:hypothetical protein
MAKQKPGPHAFLERWHAAVKARDVALLKDIIAPDCAFHSPAIWKPGSGRAYTLHVLRGVISFIENFDYRREWVDGNDILLEFTGEIGGRSLVGIDRITLDGEGRMARLEVMIRPLNALLALVEKMGPHIMQFEGEAA